MTTTDTPHADPQAARQARRTALRNLITRVGRGRAGADIGTMLGLAVDAEIADADEAHTRIADYENRITWETTCGEHARLLDSCRAADERAEKAEQRAAATEADRDAAMEDARRAMRQRQEMAEERHAWQERGDRAEKRAEKAEAALNRVWDRVRDLADRWEQNLAADGPYARARRAALDGTEPIAPDPEPCDAYQPPTTSEDSGYCARCGMNDFKHAAAPKQPAGPTFEQRHCGQQRCAGAHSYMRWARVYDCPGPPREQPAAPDGVALWATIRDHAARDHQFWTDLTRDHNRLHGHGVTR